MNDTETGQQNEEPGEVRGWRKFWLSLALLTFTTTVTLCAVEVGVRVLAPQRLQIDAPDYYKAVPTTTS